MCVPKPGETICGDGWAMTPDASGASFLLADGLGHGPDAAKASREAARIFHEHIAEGPAALLRFVHDALRSTRGAAAAIADIDCDTEVITFAGVGNIAGTVLADGAHVYVCGDAKRMAKDVEGAWVEIVAAHGARTTDEAIAFVANLKKVGRYQQDVY